MGVFPGKLSEYLLITLRLLIAMEYQWKIKLDIIGSHMPYVKIKQIWQQEGTTPNICKKFNYKWQWKPWEAA